MPFFQNSIINKQHNFFRNVLAFFRRHVFLLSTISEIFKIFNTKIAVIDQRFRRSEIRKLVVFPLLFGVLFPIHFIENSSNRVRTNSVGTNAKLWICPRGTKTNFRGSRIGSLFRHERAFTEIENGNRKNKRYRKTTTFFASLKI